ncbi:MAG: hypothetical protein K9H16_13550, partial [Bacteroidales bacterium]|nr:hypothetical protein [Bacteroidales bacterium]
MSEEKKIQHTEDKFLAPENRKHIVIGPEGEEIQVDPLQDYFCTERPKVSEPRGKTIEKFLNWARAESLWVLAFGTGCGSIELPPLFSPRFDA